MSDDHLLPLQEETETHGFDVVLRGYDRRQVEDYVERVEVALADADRHHAEDGERLAALEQELLSLQHRVTQAEEAAAGLPEPASRVGERLATMLRLAEEEAEQIVTQAQERAAASTTERTADLDRREADVAGAATAAEQTRLEAQRDAEALRTRTQQEVQTLHADARRQADGLVAEAQAQADAVTARAQEQAALALQTAKEDVLILQEEARAKAVREREAAQQQVEDLARQRDTIAAQMQALQATLSAAVQPLSPPPAP